jgi:hypothetical protein
LCIFKASTVLTILKNGTATVELPERVSSGMEHVCYLFLLTLEHVRVIGTDGQMDRWTDGRPAGRMYVCGSGRALGLSKNPHYVDPGRLLCCEQQLKIVATDL